MINPAFFIEWYTEILMLQARATHDFVASFNPFFYSGDINDRDETTLKKDWTDMMNNQSNQTANQNNVRYVTPMVNYGNAGTTDIIRVAAKR